MKIHSLYIALLILGMTSFSEREEALSFQQIVEREDMSRQDIFNNISAFVYSKIDSGKVEFIGDSSILFTNTFTVYNTLISKIRNPAGKVNYQVVFDIKENKYRITAKDYVFTPMVRNRYGLFVAQESKKKEVSEGNFKKQKKLYAKILEQCKGRFDGLAPMIDSYEVIEAAVTPAESEW